MRRPPYTNRVMRGIYLIWVKTKINIDNGYIPHWWTPQDRKDANRAIKWMGDLFDWVEWKAGVKAEAARLKEADPPVIEKEEP